MQSFDSNPQTRLIFGEDSLLTIGRHARSLNSQHAMIVCDLGILKAGHFEAAEKSLLEQGIKVNCFHDFSENPTSDMVDTGVKYAAMVKPDLLIGLGGGSSLDCCKGINFVYSCGGSIHDYHGTGKATAPMLPMIAVPTTAGTGSEAQSYALISDAKTHTKMACGDTRAAAKIAILDPKLTITQPASVTVLTGIDAISHAIETQVSTRSNAMSVTYSQRAFGMLSQAFDRVIEDPFDIEARSMMQVGAYFSGLAIENSMLGAAHATANPLTAKYGITHGQAVGVMLPSVIRLNSTECQNAYLQLARQIDPVANLENCSELLAERVTQWLHQSKLSTSLSQLGVSPDDFETLAADALKQWTGNFNPVPLTHGKVKQLYAAALEP
ncbi:MAG: iron-containing alcohol dehydrogenase [Rubripirellula sp.]|nr:iron-containing alcohol dehydrogenase [Rubripirellula sp.]